MTIQETITQHNIIYQQYINQQQLKQNLQNNLSKLQQSNKVNQEQLNLHQSAKTYIEQMVEHLTKSQLNKLEHLVNLALTVFKIDKDQQPPYEIQFDIQYKRNQNTVLINLKDNRNNTLTPIQNNGFRCTINSTD